MSGPAGDRGARLPAGFCCLRCGYDLGSTRVCIGAPCVECGRAVEQADLASWEARLDVLASARRTWVRFGAVTALVVCGAAVLGMMDEGPRAGLGYATVLAGVVAWSVLVGLVESQTAAPRLRYPWFLQWVDSVWLLHGAWLIGGLVGGPVIVIAMAVGHRELASGAGILGLALWLWASLYLLFRWERRMDRVRLATRRRFTIPALLVVLSNLIIGAVALFVSAAGAERILTALGS